jgi:hypothetical protein
MDEAWCHGIGSWSLKKGNQAKEETVQERQTDHRLHRHAVLNSHVISWFTVLNLVVRKLKIFGIQ